MTRQHIPDEVLSYAHARKAARERKDWAEADRLRREIESAGWKVVDRGTDFALSPAHPHDVDDGGRVRYGRSESVPSRLAEPPDGLATVVLVDEGWGDDVERAVRSLVAHAPEGVGVVISGTAIVDPPPPAESVLMAESLGHAAMLNAAIRRAKAPVVIVLDPSVEATGDPVTPLVRALDAPSVAVAGGWGVISPDLRRFEEAPVGDVAAIEGYAMAFRRSDYVERGPLDERFRFYRNLDLWWSLVLRGEGEGSVPRRAVVVDALPARRHEHRAWAHTPPEERDRLSKRNFYRLLDRFRDRMDLAVPG